MRPKLRLSRLRTIGWTNWDPIGLLEGGEDWTKAPFAGEYDSYLMQAASRLRRGVPVEEVVSYLCDIEEDYMGLGTGLGVRDRALQVVDAILADKDLWEDQSQGDCKERAPRGGGA